MVVVVVDLLLLLFRIYMYGLGKSLWVFFFRLVFFTPLFYSKVLRAVERVKKALMQNEQLIFKNISKTKQASLKTK